MISRPDGGPARVEPIRSEMIRVGLPYSYRWARRRVVAVVGRDGDSATLPILGDTVGSVTSDPGELDEVRTRVSTRADDSCEPITICVPSVRADTLPATIAAVRQQHYAEWELLVVVQGEDSAVEMVARRAGDDDPRIRVVHTDERGTSRARNAGVAAARYQIVAFTDDDCEPLPTWLDGLCAALRCEPGIGVRGRGAGGTTGQRWPAVLLSGGGPTERIVPTLAVGSYAARGHRLRVGQPGGSELGVGSRRAF